jgi:hypothetical protein
MWRGLQPARFGPCKDENPQAEQSAEKVDYFVILSGAKNLSLFYTYEMKERFFAPLRMTKDVGCFSAG